MKKINKLINKNKSKKQFLKDYLRAVDKWKVKKYNDLIVEVYSNDDELLLGFQGVSMFEEVEDINWWESVLKVDYATLDESWEVEDTYILQIYLEKESEQIL